MECSDLELRELQVELELCETNLLLWQEIGDQPFERYFRARYFPSERISRLEAISRFTEQVSRLQQKVRAMEGEQLAEGCWPMNSANGSGTKVPQVPDLRLSPLPPAQVPWGSLVASVVSHGLILALVLSVRIPAQKGLSIAFDTETITFYKLSKDFPDISPRKSFPMQPVKRNSAPLQAQHDVQIRREDRQRAKLIVDRPEIAPTSILPPTNLPNIVLQSAKLDPGPLPMTLPPDVVKYLSLDLPSTGSERTISRRAPLAVNAPEPLSPRPQLAVPAEPSQIQVPLDRLPERTATIEQKSALLPFAARPIESGPLADFHLSELPQTTISGLTRRSPPIPRAQVALPSEPGAAEVRLNEVGMNATIVQEHAHPLPYAAPAVTQVVVGFEVQQMPKATGANLLVYSDSPAIPKGEIAVPKTSSMGRLTASTRADGNASSEPSPVGGSQIILPSVSINSPGTPHSSSGDSAVVQAPPQRSLQEGDDHNKVKQMALLDYLPSRIVAKQLVLGDTAPGEFTASPLQEVERRGKPVYTAAINAPNFTSKRGSWIFRFAELPEVPETISRTEQPASETWLTAPSATVKVDPRYPPEVVRDKLEGVVVLFAILRKDGLIDPESIRVIRKLDTRLDNCARDALRDWKFKPSLKNGVAIDIQMEVSIPFFFHREGL